MIKYLLQKEFLQIRRNPFIPKLIFIFPIVIMCVMPWVMNLEVKNIAVVAVDNDRSTLSQRLIHRIEASNYFKFKGVRATNDEAIDDIEKSRTDIVLTIPQNYERDIANGKVPQILISANAVNGTKGSLGGSYLANIVSQNLLELPSVKQKISSGTPTTNVSTLYLYNKNLNYKLFMIPALMSMLMVMLCGFLPALNIVSEKESGTIEQINVTPVSKPAFIFAKLIPYWIIGMFVLSVCFILAWLVYGIVPLGSIPLIYFISILLAFIFSGLGLIISNYSDTLQQAIFVMWFFMVCMLLLSGLFTPVRSMPDWAQTLTYLNPIRHYIDAIRTVFIRGGSVSGIMFQICALALLATVMDIWAIVSYRKNS